MVSLRIRFCISLLVLASLSFGSRSMGTETANAASATRVANFRKLPTQVRDQIRQAMQCELDANRTIRQHNQVVDSSKQTLERKQDRTLTILEIQQGRPTKAQLDYRVSVTNVRDEKQQSVEATQPVAGHVYFIHRVGDTLTITDDKGQPITEEEDKILQNQLQNFGKPNPLAEFLHGQQIHIGQSIAVPEEVASQLLGMAGNPAKTDKLGLKLINIKRVDGQPSAVFETLLKTSGQETAMSLVMKGELVIEINTCRTRSIRLHGPVAISEARGPTIGRFLVSTNGTLDVAITTSFASDSSNRLGAKPRQLR